MFRKYFWKVLFYVVNKVIHRGENSKKTCACVIWIFPAQFPAEFLNLQDNRVFSKIWNHNNIPQKFRKYFSSKKKMNNNLKVEGFIIKASASRYQIQSTHNFLALISASSFKAIIWLNLDGDHSIGPNFWSWNLSPKFFPMLTSLKWYSSIWDSSQVSKMSSVLSSLWSLQINSPILCLGYSWFSSSFKVFFSKWALFLTRITTITFGGHFWDPLVIIRMVLNSNITKNGIIDEDILMLVTK